ncbi:MAG: NAD(P)H-hydrate dehydratase [Eubacteriales bacterium]|nr:NAD(P)H-hydrate dehydratase [Eubacteriales bacterium]
MEYLLKSDEMKQLDQAVIEEVGIPSAVLMERAALAATEALEQYFPLKKVLVVCGSGNNGGDGFAVARLLHLKKKDVTILFAGNEMSCTPETALQKKICEKYQIPICRNWKNDEYTSIVDAVFGIGLSRTIEGNYRELIEHINIHPAKVLAIDIASGICADTGEVLGTAVRADMTVTFAYKKIGHVLYPGAEYCGKILKREIGISPEATGRRLPHCYTYDKGDLCRLPKRYAYSNKGTYGRALLIAGSKNMSGAAYFSGMAAYRVGTGLVQIFTESCNRNILQQILPEAILATQNWEKTDQKKTIKELEWADAAAIGPGFGISEQKRRILFEIIKNMYRPLVIDADGLNLLADQLEILKEKKGPVIVTPHIGEMSRLIKKTRQEIIADLIGTAAAFAREYHVICVLKDTRTVVTDGKDVYINQSGNHGMAAGGSGDVLTGMITGLLAQKMEPFEAAKLGVYLHGLAGDEAKKEMGAYAMTATDILNQIGKVQKTEEYRREQ